MPLSVGVNQLASTPLRYSPIAVGVETKTGISSLEEGRRQLGVCTAAWHRRMHALMAEKTHMAGVKMVTLPLLLILEHEWRLSFAVDAGDATVRVLPLLPALFSSYCALPVLVVLRPPCSRRAAPSCSRRTAD